MDEAGLIDMAILFLLGGAIFYGWLVSRRLERLRGALLAFGPALQAFSEAVERSERSVRDLRVEGGRIDAARGADAPPRPVAPRPAPDEREVLIGAFTDFLRRRPL